MTEPTRAAAPNASPAAHHSTEGQAHVLALVLPESVASEDFDPLNNKVLSELASAPAGQWILDLTDTQYAGSALLGMLVNVRQRVLNAGGRVVLCGLSPRLRHVVQTCSLDRLFTLVKSRPDAVRHLNGG